MLIAYYSHAVIGRIVNVARSFLFSSYWCLMLGVGGRTQEIPGGESYQKIHFLFGCLCLSARLCCYIYYYIYCNIESSGTSYLFFTCAYSNPCVWGASVGAVMEINNEQTIFGHERPDESNFHHGGMIDGSQEETGTHLFKSE